MQTNIQTSIHIQIGVINFIVRNLYLVDIFDAILNFLQGSMMSRVYYFDSIMLVSKTEEAQICISYKYMVKHLKSLKKSYLAAILDAILGF